MNTWKGRGRGALPASEHKWEAREELPSSEHKPLLTNTKAHKLWMMIVERKQQYVIPPTKYLFLHFQIKLSHFLTLQKENVIGISFQINLSQTQNKRNGNFGGSVDSRIICIKQCQVIVIYRNEANQLL